MAQVVLEGPEQEVRRGARRQGRQPDDPGQGVHGPRRAVGLRQDHDAPHGGRARGDHRRRDRHRRPDRQRSAAQGPRHRHGVPELRALPAHERVRQHGLRPQDAEVPEGGDPEARAGRRRDPRHPGAAQAQAAPALRRPAPARAPWAAPSCGTRRSSSSTSRSPTSTPSCACRCASSSSACTSASRPPPIYVTHDQVEAMTLGSRGWWS